MWKNCGLKLGVPGREDPPTSKLKSALDTDKLRSFSRSVRGAPPPPPPAPLPPPPSIRCRTRSSTARQSGEGMRGVRGGVFGFSCWFVVERRSSVTTMGRPVRGWGFLTRLRPPLLPPGGRWKSKLTLAASRVLAGVREEKEVKEEAL